MQLGARKGENSTRHVISTLRTRLLTLMQGNDSIMLSLAHTFFHLTSEAKYYLLEDWA